MVSALLTAFGNQLNALLPFGKLILSAINLVISFVLITVLFAAIYKILPDRPLAWRDVIFGAIVTTVLFTAGKSLIAIYIGTSATVSSCGIADCPAFVGVLFRSDLSSGGRVHQSVHQLPKFSGARIAFGGAFFMIHSHG